MGLARKNHAKGKHNKPAPKALENFPLNTMDTSNVGKNKVV